MPAPIKLPIVTRWATNKVTLTSGFVNRLDNEPPQSFLDQGFTTNVLLRQPLNYVLYNHGENLTYSVYYTNRPFAVATKTALPNAADNIGIIYYVSDQKKLVMSIDSKWMILATVGTEI